MIPKQGSWWTFRGDQQGCGKNQQVCESTTGHVVSWGDGFSWYGPTHLFLKLFTPVEDKEQAV